MPEAEIGQIKKESVDTFGSQPELYGSIITTTVAVLSLLVSKVLRKTAELSKNFSMTKQGKYAIISMLLRATNRSKQG